VKWPWLALGALLAVASQIAWLMEHGWAEALPRLIAGLAAGALLLGPLLAWSLPRLRRRLGPPAARVAWQLSGLDTRGGRRAWLISLLALCLASGGGMYWWWYRPNQGAEKIRQLFLAHAEQTSSGLRTLLYKGLEMTGPAFDLGIQRDWRMPALEDLPGGERRNFAVRWLGVLTVPADGRYGFGGTVDDGLIILVDGRPAAADWHEGPPRQVWGVLALKAGAHALEIRYRQFHGDASLNLSWQPPDLERGPLPLERLKPLKPDPPLAEATRLRLRYGLMPEPVPIYPPYLGGRFWRLPWYALQ